MKLSDAIKAGAKLAPQAFGTLRIARYRKGKEPELATCAIGAIHMALRVKSGRSAGTLSHRFPLLDQKIPPPCGCPWGKRNSVLMAIMHLNDKHRWRRELIAQWVKHLETK